MRFASFGASIALMAAIGAAQDIAEPDLLKYIKQQIKAED